MLKSSSLLEGLPLFLMGEMGILDTNNCVVTGGGREEIGGGCLDPWLVWEVWCVFQVSFLTFIFGSDQSDNHSAMT